MNKFLQRRLRCYVIALSFSFAVLAPVRAQSTKSVTELITSGDAAMSSRQFDQAEMHYIDACLSTSITPKQEATTLEKLQQLYQESGMHPLDDRIKAKLAKSTKPASAKLKTPAIQGATTSYPVVTGEAGRALVAYALKSFDEACRSRVPGYISSKNPSGTAFQLPDGQYQVVASCDASLDVSGSYVQAQITVIQLVQYLGSGLVKALSRDVIVGDMRSADGSKLTDNPRAKPNDFGDWMKNQQRQQAEDKAHADQVAAQQARNNASDEQTQLSRHHAQTQAANGTSYFSRH